MDLTPLPLRSKSWSSSLPRVTQYVLPTITGLASARKSPCRSYFHGPGRAPQGFAPQELRGYATRSNSTAAFSFHAWSIGAMNKRPRKLGCLMK